MCLFMQSMGFHAIIILNCSILICLKTSHVTVIAMSTELLTATFNIIEGRLIILHPVAGRSNSTSIYIVLIRFVAASPTCGDIVYSFCSSNDNNRSNHLYL